MLLNYYLSFKNKYMPLEENKGRRKEGRKEKACPKFYS